MRRIFQLPALLLVWFIRAYQKWVSPLFGPTCKYYPSCSHYAVDALQVHGAVKGSLLTLGRLGRCNPFSGGGINHVPRRGEWRAPQSPVGEARPARQTRRALDQPNERAA